MRSAGGTNDGEPSFVVSAVNLRIACFGAVSFQDGSGSVWAGDALATASSRRAAEKTERARIPTIALAFALPAEASLLRGDRAAAKYMSLRSAVEPPRCARPWTAAFIRFGRGV